MLGVVDVLGVVGVMGIVGVIGVVGVIGIVGVIGVVGVRGIVVILGIAWIFVMRGVEELFFEFGDLGGLVVVILKVLSFVILLSKFIFKFFRVLIFRYLLVLVGILEENILIYY